MGWERLTNACGNVQSCGLDCTAGKNILGGGCLCGSTTGATTMNRPNSTTQAWFCQCDSVVSQLNIWAICANIR